jgi:hypothetical protein
MDCNQNLTIQYNGLRINCYGRLAMDGGLVTWTIVGPRIASRNFVTGCLTMDVTATLTFGGVCQNILLILSQAQSDAEGARSSALN